jgi:hypothetical protein
VRSALQNELVNRGLVTIDPDIIDSTCLDESCTAREKLLATYPIDAFAVLKLRSASRTNFIAGYYNSIVGQLVLADAGGRELLEVQHTESERGGILFNSGQILQGVISQIRNGDDEAFLILANKFAQSIVTSIPRSSDPALTNAPPPPIVSDTSIAPRSSAVYEVCASGTPQAFGAIVLKNGAKTNLREIAPGRYCGKYLAADPQQFIGAEVELRDAFGTAARSPLGAFPPQASEVCAGGVVATVSASRITLVSPCPTTTTRVLIYHAHSIAGPFIKIAEQRGSSWSGRTPKVNQHQTLALVAVDPNGLLSEPKLFTISSKDPA